MSNLQTTNNLSTTFQNIKDSATPTPNNSPLQIATDKVGVNSDLRLIDYPNDRVWATKKVFNVLDFGADPTGVNNSKKAIQDAINTAADPGTGIYGGTVYLPAGCYKIEGITGTHTGDPHPTTLTDSTKTGTKAFDHTNLNVQPGDLVINYTQGCVGIVESRGSSTLTLKQLSYMGEDFWLIGDTKASKFIFYGVNVAYAPTKGAVYSNNSSQYTVRSVIGAGATETIICERTYFDVSQGSKDPEINGTLSRMSGTGPDSISFASVRFIFVVTNVTFNLTVDDELTNNGSTFTVKSFSISNGSGTITCVRTGGTNLPETSGELAKGAETPIDFSSFSTVLATDRNQFNRGDKYCVAGLVLRPWVRLVGENNRSTLLKASYNAVFDSPSSEKRAFTVIGLSPELCGPECRVSDLLIQRNCTIPEIDWHSPSWVNRFDREHDTALDLTDHRISGESEGDNFKLANGEPAWYCLAERIRIEQSWDTPSIPLDTRTYAESGACTSVTANKLIDTNKTFTNRVKVGMIIKNTTDGKYSHVTAIDSATQLSLQNNIMDTQGDNYFIFTPELVASGKCDATVANKLQDSNQSFLSLVKVGMMVKNVTDSTFASITAVSCTELTLSSNIMATNENYEIYLPFQTKDSGTCDSTFSGELRDAGKSFCSNVKAGMVVKNTTDNTYSYVKRVIDDDQLELGDNIIVSGESYVIFEPNREYWNTFTNGIRLAAWNGGINHPVIFRAKTAINLENLHDSTNIVQVERPHIDFCSTGIKIRGYSNRIVGGQINAGNRDGMTCIDIDAGEFIQWEPFRAWVNHVEGVTFEFYGDRAVAVHLGPRSNTTLITGCWLALGNMDSLDILDESTTVLTDKDGNFQAAAGTINAALAGTTALIGSTTPTSTDFDGLFKNGDIIVIRDKRTKQEYFHKVNGNPPDNTHITISPALREDISDLSTFYLGKPGKNAIFGNFTQMHWDKEYHNTPINLGAPIAEGILEIKDSFGMCQGVIYNSGTSIYSAKCGSGLIVNSTLNKVEIVSKGGQGFKFYTVGDKICDTTNEYTILSIADDDESLTVAGTPNWSNATTWVRKQVFKNVEVGAYLTVPGYGTRKLMTKVDSFEATVNESWAFTDGRSFFYKNPSQISDVQMYTDLVVEHSSGQPRLYLNAYKGASDKTEDALIQFGHGFYKAGDGTTMASKATIKLDGTNDKLRIATSDNNRDIILEPHGTGKTGIIPLGGWSSGKSAILYFGDTGAYVKNGWGDKFYFSSNNPVQIETTASNRNISIMPNGTGKVGVNTTSPGEKLHVNGNIKTSGYVDVNGPRIVSGTGNPSGSVSAPKGSLYIKTDATTATTRLWINTDGGTTWAYLTASA